MTTAVAAGASGRRALLVVVAIVVGIGALQAGWRQWSADRLGSRVAAVAKPGDIRMLASETCAYCAAATRWFDAHGVPYTSCVIERDAACADEFARARGRGTPLMIVRGHRIEGYSQQEIAAALGAG
ncbi:MAG: glutaredoxin family protein [Proteobacteria bacterium]|nr:glutaredoxin family protein [Pseudomonadota bacterium]